MDKNLLIKKIGIGVGLGISLLPLLVMAQVSVDPKQNALITSPTQIGNIISRTFAWISGIVFTISLIMLLYAAILFLTAGTSEAIHTKAKSTLIFAIVGVAVAILAYSVEPFLVNFFRANFQ